VKRLVWIDVQFEATVDRASRNRDFGAARCNECPHLLFECRRLLRRSTRTDGKCDSGQADDQRMRTRHEKCSDTTGD
jgi:hypothetical protein